VDNSEAFAGDLPNDGADPREGMVQSTPRRINAANAPKL
jgi:hypothetical protein